MIGQTKIDISLLNEPQRIAVLSEPSPVLVLAGAGSGKTRVITHRIAHCLFDLDMRPWEIMALTFTNKAAREMAERVEKLINRSAKGMWIGTFHSVCARILRKEGIYGGRFSIYDTDDQVKLIKTILEKNGLSGNRLFVPKDIQGRISGLKNRMITPMKFHAMMNSAFDEQFSAIFKSYEAELVRCEALDFDDIILHTIDLFKNSIETAFRYQETIRQLLVDEYQDTNLAQYELVKLLSAKHRNIMVVGDDDQSIYSWRGADLRNILEFEKTFPDAKVIKLEENYRSTKTVLSAANAVIANNKHRKKKTLFTNGIQGDPINVYSVADEREEAREVVSLLRNGSLGNSAIFYRTNAQSRAMEDMLRNSGIPYVIVGGTRFYERQEVKDILAYLRLLTNPSDAISFFRIVNMPRRGIGDKIVGKITECADKMAVSPYVVLSHLQNMDLSAREIGALQNFKTLIDGLLKEQDSMSLVDFVRYLIEKSGYLAYWQNSTEEGADERLANIGEFVNAVEEYAERSEPPSLNGFLEEVALITDLDQVKNERGDFVTLMTLHSSKGLEYDNVFLLGLEDGLFPIQRDNDEASLEEERRLFYVGITRAKKRLAVFHAAYRRRYGTIAPAFPSMFLDELPSDCVVIIDRYNSMATGKATSVTVSVANEQHSYTGDYSQVEVVFKRGSRVRHPVWGDGVVQSVSGVADNMKAEVHFASAGVKRLMVKYAKLEIVG